MKNKAKRKRFTWVDMSPEAIDQRLRDVSQLYKLGMSIKGAKRVGKAKDLKNQS